MWHYIKDGETQGPVTPEQIVSLVQSGEITAETLVWTHGQPEWLPVHQSALRSQMPVITEPPPPPKAPGKILTSKFLITTASVVAAVIIFVAVMPKKGARPNSNSKAATPHQQAEGAVRSTQLNPFATLSPVQAEEETARLLKTAREYRIGSASYANWNREDAKTMKFILWNSKALFPDASSNEEALVATIGLVKGINKLPLKDIYSTLGRIRATQTTYKQMLQVGPDEYVRVFGEQYERFYDLHHENTSAAVSSTLNTLTTAAAIVRSQERDSK